MSFEADGNRYEHSAVVQTEEVILPLDLGSPLDGSDSD